MSRTITALFDTRADAEAGKARLEQASIDVSGISVDDQASAGTTGDYSTAEKPGFWSSVKGPMLPDDERHHYEEGLRRGGFLLTAVVSDHDTDKAVAVLENGKAVDLDGRAKDWRASGWDYAAPAAATGALAAKPAAKPAFNTDDGVNGEQRIPIVEEKLRVGKREVNRGGVRVHSYVVETPVSEQVKLREEKVSVERRPVTGGAIPADAFKERTIEMAETSEEAVVSKSARVVEELVVHKDVDTRTETVKDTVRRTEVEIDRDTDTIGTAAGTTGRTAAGVAGTAGAAAATLGDKAAGLAKEGIGSVKQGLGNLTGSEKLKQEGAAQERAGEAQKDKLSR